MRAFRRGRADRGGGEQRALGEAEALARAGRRLEAIDVLMAANRDARNAGIERRVLALRNEAFGELASVVGPETWPPDAPELFEGVEGLPAIAARELTTEAVRSGIVRHGCLHVRGLIPPDRIARLIDDIDRTFTAHDVHAEGATDEETETWYTPFVPESGPGLGMVRPWIRGGGGVLTVDSPRAAFDVLDTFEATGLGTALTGYLGERPVLGAKKWTLRRVPIDSGTNWHQDGAFLGEGIRAVNVWITLSACGEDAPSLDVVARRLPEIAPTGTEGAIFDWSVGEPVVDRVAQGAPIMRPILEAGDALLFDDMFLHRTGVSSSMTRERYAIESWFFAPSHYPLDQVPVTF